MSGAHEFLLMVCYSPQMPLGTRNISLKYILLIFKYHIIEDWPFTERNGTYGDMALIFPYNNGMNKICCLYLCLQFFKKSESCRGS